MSSKKAPRRIKRSRKLIKPGLQLRLVLVFSGIAAVALLLEFLLMQSRMAELAAGMPAGGEYVLDALPGLLLDVLLTSFGLLLPMIAAVGVLITFRVAGPVYRFERYLADVAEGKAVGPCRIRKGDELHDLCYAINRATERIQEQSATGPMASPKAATETAERAA